MIFSVIGLLALMAFGVPIGVALLIAGLAGIAAGFGPDVAMGYLQTSPFTNVASFTLIAIPLFLFMGNLGEQGAVWGRLFDFAYRWVGRFRGGLGMTAILAGTVFAAVSGSSAASAATLGKILVPEADKYGYDKRSIVATVAASGTLAIMIPPSITLIVFGVLTETSVARLFAAGVVPGLLGALAYIVTVFVMARRHPEAMPAGAAFGTRDKITSTWKASPILSVVAVVLGGIYLGWFTPTEAAAIGVVGITAVSVSLGGLRTRGGVKAAEEAVKATAMILLIVVGATIFSRLVAINRIPGQITSALEETAIPGLLIIIGLVLVYVLLGQFLEPLSMMVLTLPVAFPLVMSLGYESAWFAILFVQVAELGMITPPVGMNVYVLTSVTDVKVTEAFRACIPFYIANGVLLTILVAFPAVATWLPDLLGV
ncbi:TRAP transporter large permease [Blastococcus saxobsidens]|uniref:TRAP transporter large permease n=1 Tax=Blastococcus saxobsidens TaxID=138336 RepID=UPI000318E6F5|nr:TRAP transporter large permease [Blastococcus saxobsidens]